MNQISGSILVLAAAVLWASAIGNPRFLDQSICIAAAVALMGVFMVIKGLTAGGKH